MDNVINNAELIFYLTQMGLEEFINIYDNREEVQQICNKIGRPDLFKACIKEIEDTKIDTIEKLNDQLRDPDYSTEEEFSYSETSDEDLVEEDYIINPSNNGFCEIIDVKVGN